MLTDHAGMAIRGAWLVVTCRSDHQALLLGKRMRAIKAIIEEVADTDTTVLIRGESGAGKEVVARAILSASGRHNRPFVKVNCAALPAELLESELFGHEKGAFTGAYQQKLGKFEHAHTGTMFLDEIGELPLALQAKLLHVLQDGEFSRVGGRQLIRVDARIIASTNRNLERALARGEFREDLYYRLNVVEIWVPPLRDRRDEIVPLARHFLEQANRQAGRCAELTPELLQRFMEYPWPGNVRELDNIVRRLVVLGPVPGFYEELMASLKTPEPRSEEGRLAEQASPGEPGPPEISLGLKQIARRAALEAERRALQAVLTRVRWNRTEAAKLLKISYKTLLYKITECGLSVDRQDADQPNLMHSNEATGRRVRRRLPIATGARKRGHDHLAPTGAEGRMI
jgi:transcriptional regulator with GAF, ATPase, and Fis domain